MIAGCLLLGFAFEERGRRRWIGLAAAIPFTAMILTFTRNAYVGTLAAVALYLPRPPAPGLLFLVPALLVLFLLVPPHIRARISSIASLNERTNRDRIAMVHAGLRMIREAPLFGIGPEMVKRYYPLYRDEDAPQWHVPHLHNNTLQIAAANGLLAAAAYLGLMVLFFARTIRLLRRETPSRPRRASRRSPARGHRPLRRGLLRIQLRRHRSRDGDPPRARRPVLRRRGAVGSVTVGCIKVSGSRCPGNTGARRQVSGVRDRSGART